MFENPLMFDELEMLYKGDETKRIIFYHQVKTRSFHPTQNNASHVQPQATKEDEEDMNFLRNVKRSQKSITAMNLHIKNKDKILGT